RARPGEEEREQERDRAERLLAAREEREPRDALAGRAQLDLDAGLPVLVRLGQAQPALAAGEERGGDLGEVPLHGGEGLGEAALDGLGQVAAQALELLEARLEVGPAAGERVEPGLLGPVLLARERVHLAELLAPPLEPRQPLRELLAARPLRARPAGRRAAGGLEAAPGLVALGVDAGELDLDRALPLGRLRGPAAELDLLRPEPAQLRAELGRPGGLGAGGERGLEAGHVHGERALEPAQGGEGGGAAAAGRSSWAGSAARARRRASSSSRSASAVSPANQSSPRCGSQP